MGDYHCALNHEEYKQWINENLIPNLPKTEEYKQRTNENLIPNLPKISVTDNAPFHDVHINQPPAPN